MKYVWEQLDLRQIGTRKGCSYQSKPVGFVNLDAYGLGGLLESTTDFNDHMALETMEYSESEEDGKMPAEELAASASTSANMNYAEVQIERVQYQSVCTIFYQMAIAAGKMNADEVFPNVAAVSNTGMASANPSNYAEVQIEQSIL